MAPSRQVPKTFLLGWRFSGRKERAVFGGCFARGKRFYRPRACGWLYVLVYIMWHLAVFGSDGAGKCKALRSLL